MKWIKILILSIIIIIILVAFLTNVLLTNKYKKNRDNNVLKKEVSITNNGEINIVLNNDVDFKENDLNDNIYANYICEKCGVNIKYISVDSSREQYNHKLRILLESNLLPDAALIYERNDYLRYAKNNLLLPLNKYLWKYDNLNKYLSKEAWNMSIVDGSVYAVPMERYDPTPFVVHIRKDWLKNLGLEEPKTLEEYVNVLNAFTYNDPDRNGIDDTYGLLFGDDLVTGQNMERGSLFSDYFNVSRFAIENEKFIPPKIKDEYKDFLKFMAELYKQGVIAEDFAVLKFPQYMEKLRTGKYGMTVFYWMGRDMFSNQVPESSWIAIDPPRKKDGSLGKLIWDKPVRHYIGITKKCKEPEKVLKVLDWILSDEGDLFNKYGIEDIDYSISDKGEINYFKERKDQTDWKFIITMIERAINDNKKEEVIENTYGYNYIDRYNTAMQCGTVDRYVATAPFFEDIDNTDFNKISKDYTLKAIMGIVDVDSTWDDYIKDWKYYGGEKYIELYTKWFSNNNK